jgi:hypothetical protein
MVSAKDNSVLSEIMGCVSGVVGWVNNHGSAIGYTDNQKARLNTYANAIGEYHEDLIDRQEHAAKAKKTSTQSMGM